MKKPEKALAAILKAKKLTISAAESCTGGLLSKRLTDIAGSSSYFKGSVVAYSNIIKTRALKVPSKYIAAHGSVSEKVALVMARGAILLFKSDIAIGITGIAGPSGGTANKPVGLVYIAAIKKNSSIVKKLELKGSRKTIREKAASAAFKLAKDMISG